MIYKGEVVVYSREREKMRTPKNTTINKKESPCLRETQFPSKKIIKEENKPMPLRIIHLLIKVSIWGMILRMKRMLLLTTKKKVWWRGTQRLFQMRMIENLTFKDPIKQFILMRSTNSLKTSGDSKCMRIIHYLMSLRSQSQRSMSKSSGKNQKRICKNSHQQDWIFRMI